MANVYICSGEVYCTDCWEPCEPTMACGCGSHDAIDTKYQDRESWEGCTCGGCGRCMIDHEWWLSEDATNPEYSCWSICASCNAQVPYSRVHVEPELPDSCGCCGRNTLRWNDMEVE